MYVLVTARCGVFADNLKTRVLDLDEEEILTILSDVCQARANFLSAREIGLHSIRPSQ